MQLTVYAFRIAFCSEMVLCIQLAVNKHVWKEFLEAERSPVWLECGDGARLEWLELGWECGLGAGRQFIKGLDCCAKEGGC